MPRLKDKINTQRHKELLANPKVQAMLKTIRYAEGTAGAGGYGTRVGGEQFSDFTKKPNKKVYIKSIGDYSSAEGAYQFLNSTWSGVANKLGLKDFSPESQDIAAVDLIIQRGAMDDILNDNFQGAINKLSPEWASLPNSKGKGTYKNQKAKNLEKLAQVFYDGKPMTRPQQNEEKPTTTVIDLVVPEQSTNFASVPETAEEDKDVSEATQKLQQKQAEENFLTELYAQTQEQPTVENAPQRQVMAPQPSVLDRYAQIESFVENPVAQQGGRINQFLRQPIQPLSERNQVQRDVTQVVAQKARPIQQLNVRNKTDKEIAQEREAKIRASIQARETPYTLENWRQQLAAETAATGDKLRVSNEPNFFDDYINPAAMIGSMASNLGQAPLQAQQSDSVMPYVTAIGTPLVTGAIAGIGAKTTGQFVNNLANPLAGVRTSVPEELKQGLNSQGFLDMFKSKPKFNSEIDWSKWNKEIPENSQLMREYNAIEQQAKANGTWMKNPDGSAFQGTPEQFVQQNSENFKKSFGNSKLINPDGSPEINYHSTYNDLFDTFDINKFDSSTNDGGWYGKGFYTSPNKKWANRFGDNTLEGYLNIENPVPNDLEVFFGRNGYGSTPELGKFDIQDKLKHYDGVVTSPNNSDIERVFNNPSSFKASIGNNGMFDMNNPNIYKSIVPIAGASYLATQGQQESKQFQQGGDIPISSQGVYEYPRQEVIVPTTDGKITMKNVNYPILGQSLETGEQKMMYPEQNYFFENTKNVLEVPQLTEKEKSFLKLIKK